MIVKEVSGNLLDAEEKFVAQQCNCVTIKSHGLSRTLAQKFTWADPYALRKPAGPGRNCAAIADKPGTIRILSGGGPFEVVCLFAQWAPGKPGDYIRYYPSKVHKDTRDERLEWFKKCLAILDDKVDSPVAIPYQIGCGLAGGKWTDYRQALEDAKTEFVMYNLKRKRN